jgi:chemotaxis response regulator CheB
LVPPAPPELAICGACSGRFPLLFESVALHAGTKAIGVVPSGMSDDGSRGLAAINHHGGRVMVVDPADTACRRTPSPITARSTWWARPSNRRRDPASLHQ